MTILAIILIIVFFKEIVTGLFVGCMAILQLIAGIFGAIFK